MMRTKLRLYVSLTALAFALFTSCEKALPDVHDYYPIVKTVAAFNSTDGSVVVTGKIQSKGHSDIQVVGFCMSTHADPGILDNQHLVALQGDSFAAVYSNLNEDSTYYFKSFAANSYGYAIGNEISIDSVIPLNVDPPCSPSINHIDFSTLFGNQYIGNITVMDAFNGEQTINGSYDNGNFTLNFGSPLHTMVYTTTDQYDPGPAGQVFMNFNESGIFSNSQSLNPGSQIYVKQSSPGHWIITICNGTWTDSNNNSHAVVGKFAAAI